MSFRKHLQTNRVVENTVLTDAEAMAELSVNVDREVNAFEKEVKSKGDSASIDAFLKRFASHFDKCGLSDKKAVAYVKAGFAEAMWVAIKKMPPFSSKSEKELLDTLSPQMKKLVS